MSPSNPVPATRTAPIVHSSQEEHTGSPLGASNGAGGQRPLLPLLPVGTGHTADSRFRRFQPRSVPPHCHPGWPMAGSVALITPACPAWRCWTSQGCRTACLRSGTRLQSRLSWPVRTHTAPHGGGSRASRQPPSSTLSLCRQRPCQVTLGCSQRCIVSRRQAAEVLRAGVDAVFTFDESGVSGHANHCSTARAVAHIAQHAGSSLEEWERIAAPRLGHTATGRARPTSWQRPRVFMLETTSVLRKFRHACSPARAVASASSVHSLWRVASSVHSPAQRDPATALLSCTA